MVQGQGTPQFPALVVLGETPSSTLATTIASTHRLSATFRLMVEIFLVAYPLDASPMESSLQISWVLLKTPAIYAFAGLNNVFLYHLNVL